MAKLSEKQESLLKELIDDLDGGTFPGGTPWLPDLFG